MWKFAGGGESLQIDNTRRFWTWHTAANRHRRPGAIVNFCLSRFARRRLSGARSIQELDSEFLMQAPDDAAQLPPLARVGLHAQHELRRQIGVRAQPGAALRQVDDGAGARAENVVLDEAGAVEAQARRLTAFGEHGPATEAGPPGR